MRLVNYDNDNSGDNLLAEIDESYQNNYVVIVVLYRLIEIYELRLIGSEYGF